MKLWITIGSISGYVGVVGASVVELVVGASVVVAFGSGRQCPWSFQTYLFSSSKSWQKTMLMFEFSSNATCNCLKEFVFLNSSVTQPAFSIEKFTNLIYVARKPRPLSVQFHLTTSNNQLVGA